MNFDVISFLIGLLPGLFAGILISVVLFYLFYRNRKSKIEKSIENAKFEAQKILKKAQIDGREAANQFKKEIENEIKDKKQEIFDLQNKLTQRETLIDNRDAALLNKENALEEKSKHLTRQIEENQRKEKILTEKTDSIIKELENVAQFTQSQAKNEIMLRVESKMDKEIAHYMKSREEEAEEKANSKAKDILSLAISKHAQELTIEKTTSSITLPNDEMKGRIIGREGRNIKSMESILGVDILIDDTPETIVVSCFDPIRREIAKKTIEALISDGRIQPGRIEEIAAKMKAEVNNSIMEAGQDAVFKLGIGRMAKEEIELVGRLKYRTSYAQNGLEHSFEVAKLCGVMAAELGLDQTMAKRAGLLHDIGKALDFEVDGSHIELGARMAKKYGESDIVVNAIESHHGDVPQKYVISVLVQAADTLSAARPGARSETLEKYIQRLEQLENITKQFDGVYQSYALQSGRELRVMVLPDKVSDLEAYEMARSIKDKIEKEMNYPGQIKVSVIREYRAQETAR